MASIPYEYVLIFVGWATVFIGFMMREYIVKILGGMFLLVLGVWLIGNGIDGTNNFATEVFGMVSIGLGGYAALDSALKLIKWREK